VKVKQTVGIKRLIFISSTGIYDEVPGERYGSIIEPYRKAPSIIETSGLDYTILRPAWLDLGSPSLINWCRPCGSSRHQAHGHRS
jgi:NAD(P)H-binding